MQDVVDRLAQWLWKNCPAQLDKLAPGASDEEIAACEKELGVKFPEGLRALYRWRNGVRENEVSDVFGRYALESLTGLVRTQKIMNDLLERGDFKTKNWWRKTWIPVFDKGTGDSICWDPKGSFSGEPGQMVTFWHTDHDRTVLAPSFDAYLTAYVESLEAGVWTYNEEEGFEDNNMFEDFIGDKLPGYPHVAIDMEGRRPRPPKPPPPAIEASGTPVKLYNLQTKYEVGDTIAHPTLGTGVVQAVDQTKMDILFGTDDRRTLIHARGSGEKLGKPPKHDGSKPGPQKV